MIAALLMRDLLISARRPAFAASLLVHAGFLTMFLLAWGDGRGIPALGAPGFYGQLRLVQLLLLTLLLPWTAARCMPDECGDDLVVYSTLTAVPAATIVTMRTIAASVTLLLVCLAGVPPAIMAARMSHIAPVALFVDEVALAGAAVLVAALTLACRLEVQRSGRDRRVFAWASSTLAVVATIGATRYLFPATVVSAVIFAAAGTGLAALASGRARARYVYVTERRG